VAGSGMNKKQLKQAIKPLVRECLTEIFAEMRLESIVESVVRRNTVSVKGSRQQTAPPPQPRQSQVPSSDSVINEIRQRMALSKEELASAYGESAAIYEGVAPRAMLEEEGTNPEHVPESKLRQPGSILNRDFSKFL